LGWFPNLLKKISSRHAQQKNSMVCPGQMTACAHPGPDNQATLLAGWGLRCPISEPAAQEDSSSSRCCSATCGPKEEAAEDAA